jgi:dolichyl-phosphate-mannose-protein mannosyltransferase
MRIGQFLNLKAGPLFFLVLAGLILRLFFAFLPGFKTDIDAFFAWSLRLHDLGPSNFYSKDVFTDYTPGYLYVLYLLGFVQKALHLDSNQFQYLLKVPAIIAELIIAILCYQEVFKNKFSSKAALIISSLIFFNIGLIFNSSIWGQVDAVLTLFLVLTIYFLKEQKYLYSSFFYAITFLIKPQAIALAPLFIFFLIRKRLFLKKGGDLLLLFS